MFCSHIIFESGTYNSQLKCIAKFTFIITVIVEMKPGGIVTHHITFIGLRKKNV